MKKKYLLPSCFKPIGRVLTALCVVYLVVAWTTDLDLDFDYQTVSLYGYAPFRAKRLGTSIRGSAKQRRVF